MTPAPPRDARMTDEPHEFARWTPDCQGKWDYDGEIVSVSSRYWPRGGGFHVLNAGRFEGNETRLEIRPSASSKILIGEEEIARAEFKGDTEAEVKAMVEAWAAEQIARVVTAVRAAFPVAAARQEGGARG